MSDKQHAGGAELLARIRGKLGEMELVIEDLKQAEEALRQSEERYRLLLDASPDPISVYNSDNVVAYVNPAFEKTFGWSLGELAGKGIDFVPPEEKESTRQAVERTLKGENVTLDTTRLTKDGRELDIQLRSAVFSDGEGNRSGDIVIYRDTTESKKAQEAIRESEASLRRVLQYSPDPIAVYNIEGLVIYLNPAFEETFGWLGEEMKGKRIDFVPPQAEEETKKAIAKVVAGKAKVINFDTQRLTKDGRVLDIQLSSSFFKDREGEPGGNIVILRDISELKQAGRRKLDQGKLEAAVQTAGAACHELNQPLQAATTRLELLLQEFDQDDRLYGQLSEILTHIDRMTQITGQLQSITKYRTRPYLKDLHILDIEKST